MKKILLLLLLLVNLQITEDGILNIRIGGISAQTMLEETLDGVTVTGSAYTTCDQCHSDVLRAELEIHKKQLCPERSVECQSCLQSYKSYEGHVCNDSRCAVCGHPSSSCICSGPVIPGNGEDCGSSGHGVGYGGVIVGSTGNNSSSYSGNNKTDSVVTNKSTKLNKEDLEKYKLYYNVDTIANISLCQRDSMDCVSTQLSRIISVFQKDTTMTHMNSIRDSIETIYYQNFGIILKNEGVLPDYLPNFIGHVVEKYGLKVEKIKSSKIIEKIDSSHAIILPIGVNTKDNQRALHLVQITGYNNETKTFSVSDPRFKTQNSYTIEILTNPAYIEDEEIYAIKQKEK